MDKDSLFIQEILHVKSGEKIDLSFLLDITLVETMDLSGPRLMAEFNDPNSWLTDTMGLKEKDVLRVTISDLYVRDGISEIIDFIVWTKPVVGPTVKINAIAKQVSDLKIRATKARLFNKKSHKFILGQFFPGVKTGFGKFPVVEDYHLLEGEYPSYMLRQMAREKGAHVYLRRDTICLKRISDIMAMPEPDFTYHYNDATKENQIIEYTAPSSQHILEDKIIRRYTGWNMTKGWISSGPDSLPPKNTPYQHTLTMKNMGISQNPSIDFICTGSGFLKPGASIDLVWNTARIDSPIDESLPGRVVAGTIAHNYKANKYYCRVKGIIQLEKTNG